MSRRLVGAVGVSFHDKFTRTSFGKVCRLDQSTCCKLASCMADVGICGPPSSVWFVSGCASTAMGGALKWLHMWPSPGGVSRAVASCIESGLRFAKRCPPSVVGLEGFRFIWMCHRLLRNVPKAIVFVQRGRRTFD